MAKLLLGKEVTDALNAKLQERTAALREKGIVPTLAIILNQPSLQRFEHCIKPNGTLIYDPYGISTPPTRTDIHIYRINAMDVAAEMDNVKAFNMIVLGALLKVTPIVALENVVKALRKTLPERHHHLIPLNEEALHKGMESVTSVHQP